MLRLEALFRPKSIAVVGASEKPTVGRRLIASLDRIGFAGPIFPINPNYSTVLDRQCYASAAELPEAPDIAGFCRDAGMALCGPNCMGVLSPHHRSTSYLQELRDPAGLAGNVGIVSQSGAFCISLLTDIRRFGFSHIASSGNEAVVVAADYLDYLVDDPHTKV